MLKKFQPNIVVVMTDDSSIALRELAFQSGERAKPETFSFTREQLLSRYEKDLPQLLEAIKQSNAIPVLLSYGQKLQDNQSEEEQDRLARNAAARMPFMSKDNFLRSARWYNEANRDIARNQQVTYIEWHQQLPGVGSYFHDFRHFSPAGSARLAEILAEQLLKPETNAETFADEIANRFGCRLRSKPLF
jgi:hypothetical protein